MTARLSLRTRDLALAGGISVQQVRNYEASGLIPQAQRSPSGYRLYTQLHLAALKTVKSLVPWVWLAANISDHASASPRRPFRCAGDDRRAPR
jgi:MerR family regulatory protein